MKEGKPVVCWSGAYRIRRSFRIRLVFGKYFSLHLQLGYKSNYLVKDYNPETLSILIMIYCDAVPNGTFGTEHPADRREQPRGVIPGSHGGRWTDRWYENNLAIVKLYRRSVQGMAAR